MQEGDTESSVPQPMAQRVSQHRAKAAGEAVRNSCIKKTNHNFLPPKHSQSVPELSEILISLVE